MYRTVEMVFGGIFLVLLALAALGRRYPHIPVLRAFRDAFPRLPEEQQARIRRRANTYAGIEMILMGIVLPIGYFFLTMMTFSDFDPTVTALVFAFSILLIGLGITAIWRSRR